MYGFKRNRLHLEARNELMYFLYVIIMYFNIVNNVTQDATIRMYFMNYEILKIGYQSLVNDIFVHMLSLIFNS